jgi:hypothetical protein
LVSGVRESVRRWRTITNADGTKMKRPEDITTRPLPNPDELNQRIPKEEWERQLDGNNTAGAHIAWDALKEAVITMRGLRGEHCFPLVNLTERPMKSAFRPNGMGARLHFDIVGWRTPGEPSVVTEQSTPRLTGPAGAPVATSVANSAASTPTPPTAPAAARAARPHPMSTPASKPPSAKTPVRLSDYTLAVMGEPKPVTTEELLNDSLDDMPWDADPEQR